MLGAVHGRHTVTEPGPITWALDLLQAHNMPPLAEGEDERRLLGELVSLGWEVSWTEDPVSPPTNTWYQRCLKSAAADETPNRQWHLEQCEQLKSAEDRDRYEVTGKTKWLPVGEVRFVVQGESLQEAALFGLAMALDLQRSGT